MSGKAASPHPVYAIVVNYNGWRDTIECLESLLRSHHRPLRVILCDNASGDDSVDRILRWARGDLAATASSDAAIARLSQPPVPKPVAVAVSTDKELTGGRDKNRDKATVLLVRCGSNLGFAGANNVALRYVLTREDNAYALLFNNDAVAAPDAIGAMVEHANSASRTGAVGATVLQYRRPERIETLAGARISRVHGMVRRVNTGLAREQPRPRSVDIDYVTGCCLLVPRATVEGVGFMDERYFLYGEDADWCLRMKRYGLGLGYSPEAEIWHKGGASVVHRSTVHDYYTVRATLMVVHSHFPLTLPIALAHAVLRFILPKLVRGEWRRLAAAARGYRDFIRQAVRATREQPA